MGKTPLSEVEVLCIAIQALHETCTRQEAIATAAVRFVDARRGLFQTPRPAGAERIYHDAIDALCRLVVEDRPE